MWPFDRWQCDHEFVKMAEESFVSPSHHEGDGTVWLEKTRITRYLCIHCETRKSENERVKRFGFEPDHVATIENDE